MFYCIIYLLIYCVYVMFIKFVVIIYVTLCVYVIFTKFVVIIFLAVDVCCERMNSSYEDIRRKTIEENQKKMQALNLTKISQSLYKSSSSSSKPSSVSNKFSILLYTN
jgi:hypothetical protein